MRVVVQRVRDATVRVSGTEVGAIDRGLLVLVAFARGDTEAEIEWMARKVVSLRIFEDGEGRMNQDLEAVGGSLLVVSQFTLYGDCRKGKRPSFEASAPADRAEALYGRFVAAVRAATSCPVETGTFQAHMDVVFVNDGPVTLVIDREAS